MPYRRGLTYEELEPRALLATFQQLDDSMVPLAAESGSATVRTDKSDYMPMETAIISAAGFSVGEAVEFQVLHIDGRPNTGHGHEPWQVVDGSAHDLDGIADGNLTTTWYVHEDDSLGAKFELTALGLSSSSLALHTFTDGNESAPTGTVLFSSSFSQDDEPDLWSSVPSAFDFNWDNDPFREEWTAILNTTEMDLASTTLDLRGFGAVSIMYDVWPVDAIPANAGDAGAPDRIVRPDPTDRLLVQYWNGDWHTIRTEIASFSHFNSWHRHRVDLPPEAMHSNFEFKFSTPDVDNTEWWAIDNVVVIGRPAPTITVPPAHVVLEGGRVLMTATPGASGPTVTAYEWQTDLNGDGTFETSLGAAQTAWFEAGDWGLNGHPGASRQVRVRAFGDGIWSAWAMSTVTISNSAPTDVVITPAPTNTLTEGSVLRFTGSATDPGNDPLTYAWTVFKVGVTAPIATTSGPALEFTAPDDGEYRVDLVASDGPATASAQYAVNVADVLPTITSVTNTGPAAQGSFVTVEVHAEDPAGANDALEYLFDFDDDGTFEVVTLASSAAYVFYATGEHRVRVRVRDDAGNSIDHETNVTVNAATPLGDSPDGRPWVSLTSPYRTITEDAGVISVTARLSKTTNEEVRIPLQFAGTAAANADYSAAGEILIPAGALTGSADITIVNDDHPESSETLIVRLLAPVNAHLSTFPGDPLQQTITLLANDVPDAPTAITVGGFLVSNLVFTNGGQTLEGDAKLPLAGDVHLVGPLQNGQASLSAFIDDLPFGNVTLGGGTITLNNSGLSIDGRVNLGSLGDVTFAGAIFADGTYTLGGSVDLEFAGFSAAGASLTLGDHGVGVGFEIPVPAIGDVRFEGFYGLDGDWSLSGTYPGPVTVGPVVLEDLSFQLTNTSLTLGANATAAGLDAFVDADLTATIFSDGRFDASIDADVLAIGGFSLGQAVVTFGNNNPGRKFILDVTASAQLPVLDGVKLAGRIEEGGQYSFSARNVSKTIGGFSLPRLSVTLSNSGLGVEGSAALPLLSSVYLAGQVHGADNYTLTASNVSRLIGGIQLPNLTVTLSNAGLKVAGRASLPHLGRVDLEGRFDNQSNYSLKANVDRTIGGFRFANLKVELSGSGLRVAGKATLPVGEIHLTGVIRNSSSYSLTGSGSGTIGGFEFANLSVSLSQNGLRVAGHAELPLLGQVYLAGSVSSRYSYSLEASNVPWSTSWFSAPRLSVTLTNNGLQVEGDVNLPVLNKVNLSGRIYRDGSFSLSAGNVSKSINGFSFPDLSVKLSDRGLSVEGEVNLPVLGSVALRGAIERSGSFSLSTSLNNRGLAGATLYNVTLSNHGVSVSAWAPFLKAITLSLSSGRLAVSMNVGLGSLFTLKELQLYSSGKFKLKAHTRATGDFWVEGPDLGDLWDVLNDKLPQLPTIDGPRVGGWAGETGNKISTSYKDSPVGKALNGITAGALIYFDANRNGRLDSAAGPPDGGVLGEPWTIVSPQGEFLPEIPSEFDSNDNGVLDDADGQWVVVGGEFSATGVAAETMRIAPGGWVMVTPLSTLVSTLINNYSLSVAEASQVALRTMALPTVDLPVFDSLKASLSGDPAGAQTYIGNALLTGTVAQMTALYADAVAATPEDLSRLIMGAIGDSAIRSAAPIDFAHPAAVESILRSVGDIAGADLPDSLVIGASSVIAAANSRLNAIDPATAGLEFIRQAEQIKKVAQGVVVESLRKAANGELAIEDVVSAFTGDALEQQIAAVVIPPTLLVPETMVVEATEPQGAAVTLPVVANDLGGASLPVVLSHASGSMFALGGTVVTASTTDHTGATVSAQFVVRVVDTRSPVLTPPTNLTFPANDSSGGMVSLPLSIASDLVDPNPVVTYNVASGLFPLGTTEITATATDSSGNTSAATFLVTVADVTPPMVATPDDMVIEATQPGGADVYFPEPTATDNIDPAPSVVYDFSSSFFNIGTTTVTVIATDAAGNIGTGTFNVTVVDSTPPEISTPTGYLVEADTLGGAFATVLNTLVRDEGDPAPTIVHDIAAGILPLGTTTVTLSATDQFGNSSSASISVTVVDTNAPTLAPLPSLVIAAEGPAGASVTLPDATATDLTDPAPVVAYDFASGIFPIGTTVVTATATDASGNTATTTFAVTVVDPENGPPLVAAANLDANVHTEGAPVTVRGTAIDRDTLAATSAEFHWAVYKAGSTEPYAISSGLDQTEFSFTPDDGGEYRIELAMSNGESHSDPVELTVIVLHAAPVVDVAYEAERTATGTIVHLDATVFDPSIQDTAAGFRYFWTVTQDGNPFVAETEGADQFDFVLANAGSYLVHLTVADKDGDIGTTVQTIGQSAPVAEDAEVQTAEDTAVSGALQAYDRDADLLTFVLVDSPLHGSVIISPDGSFTYTPEDEYYGEDAFTYRANDAIADGSIATVRVSVSPMNDAPVAAASELTVEEDGSANGSLDATDRDSSDLTFQLVETTNAPGTIAILDAKTGAYSYTPAANFHGQASFTFRVTDGSLQSDTATVHLVVNAVNDLPVAAAGGDLSADEGGEVILDAGGSFDVEDGDDLDYHWEFGDGATSNGRTISHIFKDDGVYTVTLTVTDASGASSSDSTTVVVRNLAPSPEVVSISEPQSEGAQINMRGLATDPAGGKDAITLSWSIYLIGSTTAYATGSGGTFAFVPSDDGTYRIVLTAADEDGGHTEIEQTIDVDNVAPAPSIDAISLVQTEGTQIDVTATAADPAGASDTLTYSYAVYKNGSTLAYVADSGLGLTSFNFTPDDNGSYQIVLTVSDEDGGSATVSQAITVANLNPAPSINSISTVREEGTEITVTASATDPAEANDALTYSYEVFKDGSSTAFASQSGGDLTSFGFTPYDNGSYEIVLTVSDEDGGSAVVSQTIAVANLNPAPSIDSISAVREEGTAITVATSATDLAGANDTLTYSYAVLKDGAAFASQSGVDLTSFSFTPDDNGSYEIVLTVSDEDGGVQSHSVEVGVENIAPTAMLSGPSALIYGDNVTAHFSNQFDPSPADTAAGFRYAFALNSVDLDAVNYDSGSVSDDSWAFGPLGAGTYTVFGRVIDKDGGYSQYQFEITVSPAALTVTANDSTKVYGQANPPFSVSYDGFVLGQDESALGGALAFSTAVDAASDVGQYVVSASGLSSNNYAITYETGLLSITAAGLVVTAADASWQIGMPFPVLTGTVTGIQNNDAIAAQFTTTATSNSVVGTYPITGSVTGERLDNYRVTFVGGTLTLNPGQVEIDIRQPTWNIEQNGAVSLVIFGSSWLDAATISINSLSLAGVELDVFNSQLKDENADGRKDLTVHFKSSAQLQAALRELYADELLEDYADDGQYATKQDALVALDGAFGQYGQEFTGADSTNIFLAGKALKTLLKELGI